MCRQKRLFGRPQWWGPTNPMFITWNCTLKKRIILLPNMMEENKSKDSMTTQGTKTQVAANEPPHAGNRRHRGSAGGKVGSWVKMFLLWRWEIFPDLTVSPQRLALNRSDGESQPSPVLWPEFPPLLIIGRRVIASRRYPKPVPLAGINTWIRKKRHTNVHGWL